MVIEGSGFGTDRGTVRFTRIGGGFVEGSVADSDWTPFTITTAVPDSAALGREALDVITAAGTEIIATLHILPRPSFDTGSLEWVAREAYPGSTSGIALTAATVPSSGEQRTTLYAAGGAEPPSMTPDSGVYLARVITGGAGAIEPWIRQTDTSDPIRSRVLPVPRAFAATAVATPYNSRFPGMAMYVIGGVDRAGLAQASVLGADVTLDSVSARFVFLEPLPAPRAGAIAIVRRGRIYVIGGTDALGNLQTSVFVGRIGTDGHIDGWYVAPSLLGPRAYGGGVGRDEWVAAVGGVAGAVPVGGGTDPSQARLVTGDTAAVSLQSGFFTGAWVTAGGLLPDGRSQFALLDLGPVALAVGGMYAGAASNAAETIAATVTDTALSAFAGPVGTNQIANLTCLSATAGTLIGPAGVSWRDSDGTAHGLVVGGLDLVTQTRRSCAWGF
ncbi:MAG TPA: hypothetical protein VG454_15155 [Gemmatimonadales bacterium]|nr:hypothetical protein [Gemmatimonadales bacterium]